MERKEKEERNGKRKGGGGVVGMKGPQVAHRDKCTMWRL